MIIRNKALYGGGGNLLLIFYFNLKGGFTSLELFICISKWQHGAQCSFKKD